MEQPIFEQKFLGSHIAVYQDRLVYKLGFFQKSIPISQIASVDLGNPVLPKITIETTGGKRIDLTVTNLKNKQKIEDAIYQAKQSI